MLVKASLLAREFGNITEELYEMFGKQVGLAIQGNGASP